MPAPSKKASKPAPKLVDATSNVRSFREANEAFVKRHAITPDQVVGLYQYAHDRAFTYAGAAELDIVKQVHDSMLDALDKGTPLKEWQRDIESTLRRDWGGYRPREGVGARIETIARNAAQRSYNAGRYAQLRDPTMVKLRPYWMYDAILDGRTSRICKSLGDPPTILPESDPFWLTHTPPLHHRCRATLRALRKKEVDRKGGLREPPEGIKAPPPGWGRSPDIDIAWKPAPEDIPPGMQLLLEEKLDDKPPRPHLFDLARHVDKVSELKQDVVRDAIDSAGLGPLLEKHPLVQIEVLDVSDPRSAGIGGAYFEQYVEGRKKLGVRVIYTPKHNRSPLSIKNSVAGRAETADENLRRKIYHELGHHSFGTLDRITAEHIEKTFVTATPVSKYGAQNAREWFAESFSSYFSEPDLLRKRDPVGYAAVETALKEHGLVSRTITSSPVHKEAKKLSDIDAWRARSAKDRLKDAGDISISGLKRPSEDLDDDKSVWNTRNDALGNKLRESKSAEVSVRAFTGGEYSDIRRLQRVKYNLPRFNGDDEAISKWSAERRQRIEKRLAGLEKAEEMAAIAERPHAGMPLYRGVRMKRKDLEAILTEESIALGGSSSSSVSPAAALRFSVGSGSGTKKLKSGEIPVVLEFVGEQSGVSVDGLTKFKAEHEVILPAKSRYRAVSVRKGRYEGKDVYVVQVEEVK